MLLPDEVGHSGLTSSGVQMRCQGITVLSREMRGQEPT